MLLGVLLGFTSNGGTMTTVGILGGTVRPVGASRFVSRVRVMTSCSVLATDACRGDSDHVLPRGYRCGSRRPPTRSPQTVSLVTSPRPGTPRSPP